MKETIKQAIDQSQASIRLIRKSLKELFSSLEFYNQIPLVLLMRTMIVIYAQLCLKNAILNELFNPSIKWIASKTYFIVALKVLNFYQKYLPSDSMEWTSKQSSNSQISNMHLMGYRYVRDKNHEP